MSHFLLSLLSLPAMFSGCCEVVDFFDQAICVKAYENGEELEMNQEKAKEFYQLFEKASENALQYPAYCVAEHQTTNQELKEGVWLNFVFMGTQWCNQMPFDQLLFKVEKENKGVNIIRANAGYLDGRCFFLEFEENLNQVYDYLVTLEKTNQEQNEDQDEEDEKINIDEKIFENKEREKKEETVEEKVQEEKIQDNKLENIDKQKNK